MSISSIGGYSSESDSSESDSEWAHSSESHSEKEGRAGRSFSLARAGW